jgi:ribosome maturation protein SDO1
LVVDIDKAVVARLRSSDQKFEILVDPERALKLKRGKKIKMDEILAYPAIYRDARSTDIVPEQDLQKVFGTTDVSKIAEKIIKNGELQLTTEQRRKMVEEKKNQIATIISKKATNPQTNSPHPPQRILNAMEEAGVRIDPFKDAELQIDNVLREIKVLLPIKLQKIVFQIKIPPQFSGKSYSVLKDCGKILQEKWLNDGSLQINLEILAGVQDELLQKISSLTHGDFESKVLRREDV